jgi:hypothetical protein
VRHHSTVCAILCWVRVWVVRIDVKYYTVGSRIATAEDGVTVQERKFFQLLAVACVGKLQLSVVAEVMRVAT